jgi:hypothetical protein
MKTLFIAAILAGLLSGLTLTEARAYPPPNYYNLYLQERKKNNTLNRQNQQLQGSLNAARQANRVLNSKLINAQAGLNAAINSNQTIKGQRDSALAGLSAERGARQVAEQALASEQQGREDAEKALAEEQQRRQELETAYADEQQQRQDAERQLADEKQKREDAESKLAEAQKRIAELEKAASGAPGPTALSESKRTLHTMRYLRVQNDTGRAVKLFVQYRTQNAKQQWVWHPSAPPQSNDALTFDIAPGAVVDVKDQDRRVSASRVRVWTTTNGSSWLQYKDQDLWLVPEKDVRGRHVYSAREMQTYTLRLAPAQAR